MGLKCSAKLSCPYLVVESASPTRHRDLGCARHRGIRKASQRESIHSVKRISWEDRRLVQGAGAKGENR
jgi:hypothetical protein